MTSSSHHICSQVVLTADYNGSESAARMFMKDLPHWVQDALDYLSDELNDLPAVNEKSIRFSELKLDIGPIDERYFKDEFKNKLKKALFDKIEQIETHSGTNGPAVESIDVIRQPVRLIRYLLLYGVTPWWAGSADEIRLQNLIGELIRENPKRIAGLLRRIGEKSEVRLRLIQRLSEASIQQIVRIAEPVNADFIQGFIKSMIKTGRQLNIPEAKFKTLIWDSVLDYLFTTTSRQFNREAFIEWTLKKIATGASYNPDLLAEKVMLKGDIVQEQELSQSLMKLFKVNAHTVDSRPDPVPKEDPAIELNQLLLNSTSENESSHRSKIRNHWRRLFIDGDQEALLVIYRIAKKALIRRHMALFLSEKDLQKIVRMAEPGDSSFILDQSKRAVQMRQFIPQLQISKADLKVKSWEFILTYLFNDKGSQFNRKQFLRSTLEQFSAHYNLRYTELLRYFIVLTADENSGTASAVNSLLSELEKDSEKKTDNRSRPLNAPGAFKEMTEKARLWTYSKVSKYADEIYRYAKHDPEQLRYLLKTEGYSDDGLIYIWGFLSRPQKGIVLMAVSSPKIRGWEQLVSQIETNAQRSESVNQIVELEDVFDLIFSCGVLKAADMESILSLYLKDLAKLNKISKKRLLKDLSAADQNRDDRQWLSYLNLQTENGSLTPKAETDSIGTKSRSNVDRLIQEVERHFKANTFNVSDEFFHLFNLLNEDELGHFTTYMNGKKGWDYFAGKLSPNQWKDIVISTLSGDLSANVLAIYDLFTQIFNVESTAPKSKNRLQVLRVDILRILMGQPGILSGRTLMQQLLSGGGGVYTGILNPEAIRDIRRTTTISQVEYFNQWVKWHEENLDEKPLSTGSVQTKADDVDVDDVEKVLRLINKLSQGAIVSNERLLFPLLFRLLENRESRVIETFINSARDPNVIQKWLENLPVTILQELAALFISEAHLKQTKEFLFDIEQFVQSNVPAKEILQFESSLLLTYAAKHRYRNFSAPDLSVISARAMIERSSPSAQKEKAGEITGELIRHLKMTKTRELTAIKKSLQTFSESVIEEKPIMANENNDMSENDEVDREPSRFDEPEFDGEAIYITRAGLILAAPFFPRLFDLLGYLEEGKFSDDETISRAIHVMEFLATGCVNVEEHQLVIHKILPVAEIP